MGVWFAYTCVGADFWCCPGLLTVDCNWWPIFFRKVSLTIPVLPLFRSAFVLGILDGLLTSTTDNHDSPIRNSAYHPGEVGVWAEAVCNDVSLAE